MRLEKVFENTPLKQKVMKNCTRFTLWTELPEVMKVKTAERFVDADRDEEDDCDDIKSLMAMTSNGGDDIKALMVVADEERALLIKMTFATGCQGFTITWMTLTFSQEVNLVLITISHFH